VKGRGLPLHPENVLEKMRSRVPKSIDETLFHVQLFEDTYKRFDFTPTHQTDRQDGGYYLEKVDIMGVRSYVRHNGPDNNTNNAGGGYLSITAPLIPKTLHVTRTEPLGVNLPAIIRLEILQDTIDDYLFAEILEAIEPGAVHVFSSACDNFNVGASAVSLFIL
jgi:hypothetical protein